MKLLWHLDLNQGSVSFFLLLLFASWGIGKFYTWNFWKTTCFCRQQCAAKKVVPSSVRAKRHSRAVHVVFKKKTLCLLKTNWSHRCKAWKLHPLLTEGGRLQSLEASPTTDRGRAAAKLGSFTHYRGRAQGKKYLWIICGHSWTFMGPRAGRLCASTTAGEGTTRGREC